MDPMLLLAAAGIGIVVGLTGMGGGALMTPTLVLFFGVPPLTAVSSDLVASAVMKPFGSAVHARRGTVNWKLVLWLIVGSVPAAFAGVLVVRAFGPIAGLQDAVKVALGVALLLAAAGLFLRSYLKLVERSKQAQAHTDADLAPVPVEPRGSSELNVRPIPTVIIGVVGGLMVGLTSVGSGSLIIIALMFLYPALSANKLVGTDLAQAVPLVVAAALGHLFFGSVDWSVVLPVALGSIPGVLLGAYLSSRMSGGFVRRALAVILLAAGVKLLGLSNELTIIVAGAGLVLGTAVWMLIRRLYGFRPLVLQEKRAAHDWSVDD